jgi:hypothetical protein
MIIIIIIIMIIVVTILMRIRIIIPVRIIMKIMMIIRILIMITLRIRTTTIITTMIVKNSRPLRGKAGVKLLCILFFAVEFKKKKKLGSMTSLFSSKPISCKRVLYKPLNVE